MTMLMNAMKELPDDAPVRDVEAAMARVAEALGGADSRGKVRIDQWLSGATVNGEYPDPQRDRARQEQEA